MPAPTSAAPSGFSLERKLPTLLVALLLAVVTAFGWAAYREVRRTAVRGAAERLRLVNAQLAASIQTANAQRRAAIDPVVRDSAVVNALRRGGHGAIPPSVMARVARTRTRTDSTIDAWMLLGPGTRLTSAAATSADDAALDELLAQGPADSVHFGPIYSVGGQPRYWAAFPVRDAGGRAIGWLAERRHVPAVPGIEDQLYRLSGERSTLYLANRSDGAWLFLRDGRQVKPRLDVRGLPDTVMVTAIDGQQTILSVASTPGSGWIVVLMERERVALDRPRAVLRRIFAVGFLVLLLGAVGAWLLSRTVTRPLRAVTDAAAAMASGDFDRRVPVTRDDELGRLAGTFNTMAGRISASHGELEDRVAQSVAMTARLQQLNTDLRAAQEEALRAVARLERLQSVSTALAGALDIESVATVIMEQGLAALDARAGSVYTLAEDGATLQLVRGDGYPDAVLRDFATIPLDAAMPIAEAARRREPVFHEGRVAHEMSNVPDSVKALPVSPAIAAVPLLARDRLIGVIGLSFGGPVSFDRETRAFLVALAQQCAQSLDRALLFDSAVQARQEAEQAHQAAEEASRAKSEFLATMSHELRTPLNAIGGYAELMELGIRGPVTDAQREDLSRIRRSQQHLVAVINDILNLSRIEAGQLTLHLEEVPIASVVREVEVLVGPQAAARDLQIDSTGVAPALVAHADREKLQQLLLNLVSNAVRFTEPGGAITIAASAGHATVSIEVRDTGIGIPADQLEAIFEPFVQVDTGLTRRTGGTGLGLAISRDLAAAMGGHITVASELGVGSVFTVTVPRSGAEPAGPPRAIVDQGQRARA